MKKQEPQSSSMDIVVQAVIEMQDVSLASGGNKTVDRVSLELRKSDVLGLVSHNGAGKCVLMKILSAALRRDQVEKVINGKKTRIEKPSDARSYGIETIYQILAMADNLDTAGNLFLGRELLTTRLGTLDDVKMEAGSHGTIEPALSAFQSTGANLVGWLASVGGDYPCHSV